MANERLYASALNDVRYLFGRPTPFDPKLAQRLCSTDQAERKAAWAEAEQRYG